MRKSFKEIADRLIKNPRWVHLRGKVRRALEGAYQAGRDDAAAEVEAAGRELADRIRNRGLDHASVATHFSHRADKPGVSGGVQ